MVVLIHQRTVFCYAGTAIKDYTNKIEIADIRQSAGK